MTEKTCTYRPDRPPKEHRPTVSDDVLRWFTEWDAWKDRPEVAARVSSWQQRRAYMAMLRTPDEIVAGCGRDRTVPPLVADRRMAALVEEARYGDQVAARILLQRVLPALIARSGVRARRGHASFGTLLAGYTSAAWIAILTYPLDRRPVKIAANIVYEAEHELFGRPPLIDRRTVPAVDIGAVLPLARLDGRPVDAPDDPLIEVVDVLARARRNGLAESAVRLLVELAVEGRTEREIALRTGVTERAVRGRRQRAVVQLTQLLELPAPPARIRRMGTAA